MEVNIDAQFSFKTYYIDIPVNIKLHLYSL